MGYKYKKVKNCDIKGVKICRIANVPFAIVAQLNNQIECFRNIGMEVVIITSNGPELSKVKTSSTLRINIIEISRSLNILKDIVSFYKLLLFYLKERFIIVHSTTPKAGLLSAVAAYLAGIPLRVHTFTGQPWVTLKRGPLRWSARFADRIIGLLNTKCYADSRSQRQLLIDEGIISYNKIDVIGSGSLAGVDIKRFNSRLLSLSERKKMRQELSIKDDSSVIIFIGRITKDKGINELILSFKKVIDSGYNADLLLVGPQDKDRGGTDSINFDHLISQSRIHFVGYTDYPERYLSISDILCLPSYREGFGTVVIEAAAMGIPAIGTKINGLIDAIVDGETGLLVPPANIEELYKALILLISNRNILVKLGKAAKERCITLFNSENLNMLMIEEYKRLLTAKR